MFKIKYLEHTADILFTINANTFSELCKGAATTTFESMANLKKVSPKITKKIKLKNKDYEKLLFDFIGELIYLKDAEYLLFSKFKIQIKKDKDSYVLNSEVLGEKINPKKHELKVDVKAITLHEFYVKKIKDQWKARIILDI
ncbi:MAG: archease [Candidatus Woesearchaeota archaeon]